MDIIEQLFNRMNTWRHLPNYQLERRADLLFSLYLCQALLSKTGIEINETFVPEFPARIGTIYPGISTDKSYKIDYVTVSKNRDSAFLIELKTEDASRRAAQDKYLIASKKAGMTALLQGVLQIFRATLAKHKYFYLLKQLEKMGLVLIPNELENIMHRKSLQGANEASESIKIVSHVSSCEILYIQPNGIGEHVITFAEFADTIENNQDPFAKLFARSLREWAEVKAGQHSFI